MILSAFALTAENEDSIAKAELPLTVGSSLPAVTATPPLLQSHSWSFQHTVLSFIEMKTPTQTAYTTPSLHSSELPEPLSQLTVTRDWE